MIEKIVDIGGKNIYYNCINRINTVGLVNTVGSGDTVLRRTVIARRCSGDFAIDLREGKVRINK